MNNTLPNICGILGHLLLWFIAIVTTSFLPIVAGFLLLAYSENK